MYLMQCGKETVYDVIQDIGLMTFPPGEPVEVPDEFIGRAILRHKKLQGLVEVPATKSRMGVALDIEAAKVTAKKALIEGQKYLVDNYIKEQQARMAVNYPVIPPSPVVATIASEQGIDFREYGLTPPGVKITNKPNERIEVLEQTVQALLEQNRLLMAKFDEQGKTKKG